MSLGDVVDRDVVVSPSFSSSENAMESLFLGYGCLQRCRKILKTPTVAMAIVFELQHCDGVTSMYPDVVRVPYVSAVLN